MALLQGYPKARDRSGRTKGHDSATRISRKAYFKAAGLNFLMLQVLFLGLFCYIFGAIFQQGPHTHNLNIVFVDYDNGVIGRSIRNAYAELQADTFPSLQERPAAQYPSPDQLTKAVCKTDFWAALYVAPGASQRLENALDGSSSAATYNRSDALTYIWNEARYPTVADSSLSANIETLSSAARVAYSAINGTGALQMLNTSDPTSITVFANPWQLSSVNLQPTTQGSRLIYNTLVIILILIQEFFYLGVINGLYAQFKFYVRFLPHRIILYRGLVSLAYTFCGSLCVTGAIWAFRAGWNVNGNQFALSWAILWLFAHVNFLWLDVFSVWLPVQFLPMALITWVVFNVASILLPFELSPGFYRWAFAMPAHEVYLTLIDIWSGGCNPHLSYALPIMFSLEVLGWFLSAVGVYRRCHYAVIAETAAQNAFQERLNAAMEFERKHDQEIREAMEGSQEVISEAKEREKMGEEIEKQETKMARDNRRASVACNFGPSFELVGSKSNA
ncbi:uncharacterized protein LY89DRAFT_621185 [Mollisia scopiformis]|uniref:DUF3533 domain-containing protein n=1 Tax=Mollisia scopiformis TaxID=149040 RepID=A0A194X467_MOLSC|nr:uncharacterized protein LY89DRAFT_621185 [Mollisia scopiformis]KUJ14607.1 hypothetical protein LY89DRAFT_621185 [Mollisia scopiformis]